MENKFLGCFGTTVLLIVTIVGGYLLHSWVLSLLWGWFVVPLFGLRVLSVIVFLSIESMGISCVITFLTQKTPSIQKNEDDKIPWEKFFIGLLMMILTPLLALFIGWIIKGLM